MPTRILEAGISTDFMWIELAFRMRVSMSAMGSVIMGSAPYQEAFVMPGICPRCARSRRQILQIPNLRYTARARPQKLQRVYARVLYFGLRLFFSMSDALAMS